MSKQTLQALLVGAGFMGKTHLKAAEGLDTVRYVGVVDPSAAAARSLADAYGLEAFADLADAVDRLKPDAVDICAPTPSHASAAMFCASRGLAVLCEKPIALTLEDALSVQGTFARSNGRIMVAQVLRFWPEYRYAFDAVREKRYGEVLSIDCRRLASPPSWNAWMTKEEIGGGAVIDLQIHDMDFIRRVLGKPAAIDAVGRTEQGAINAVTNRLYYPFAVSARSQASYLMPASYPFRMFFSIEFEIAVMEMDFWREKGQRLKVFPKDGAAFAPELEEENAYRNEIAYFARQVLRGDPFAESPLDEAIGALEMCLASKRSCASGNPVN